jgi:hypothetical protein
MRAFVLSGIIAFFVLVGSLFLAYARLLLFELDHGSLRLLPEMEVKTVAGERLVLRNNLERILSPDIEQVRTGKKF